MNNGVGKMFCDTYVRDGPACCYIMMPVMLVNKRLGQNREIVLAPNARRNNLVEVDGVPAFRVRRRFKRAISRWRDGEGVACVLRQIFTDEGIKALFVSPNIWLLDHNAKAARRRRTEICDENYKRKRDPGGYALQKQCSARIRSAQRENVNTRRLGL